MWAACVHSWAYLLSHTQGGEISDGLADPVFFQKQRQTHVENSDTSSDICTHTHPNIPTQRHAHIQIPGNTQKHTHTHTHTLF